MSKLLMGALVVLTMGVVSSCKDYDDDIDNLTNVTNSLQQQVNDLETAKNTAANDIAAANKAIVAAQTDATKALQDIQTARTELQNAIDAAAAAAAQAKLDAANAAEQAALAKEAAATAAKAEAEAREAAIKELQDQLNALNAAISAKVSQADYDAMIATLATKEGMAAALEPLKADIAELNALLAANAKNDDALAATVAAISARLDTEFAKYVKNEDFQAAIAEINARIAAIDLDAVQKELRALIDANTGQIAANSEAIDKNAAAIAALQLTVNQIDANKKLIDALDARVGNLEEAVKAISKLATKDELAEVLIAIENVKTAVAGKASQADIDAAVATAVATINETIAKLATKEEVAGLAGEIGTIQTTLNELTAAVTALQNNTANEEKIQQLNTLTESLQDQINNLAIKTQDDVDALKSAIFATVETMIAAKTATIEGEISTLTAGIAGNNTKIGELQTAISNIQTAMASFATTNTVNDINGRLVTVENELAGLTAALNDIANELAGLNSLEEAIAPARLLGANAASAASTLADVLKAMNDKIVLVYNTLSDVVAKVDQTSSLASTILTSIVTKPSEWIYGLPRIDAIVVAAQKTYTVTVSNGRETVTESTNQKGYSFTLAANYWLNPFTADYTKYDYAFEELPTKNTITRASNLKTNAKPVVNEDGVSYDATNKYLTVQFHFENAENVNDALTQGQTFAGTNKETFAYLTTIALKATLKDAAADPNAPRTVISDYAVVVPSYLKDLVIGNNLWATTTTHQMGNQEYHVNTALAAAKRDDSNGNYSFTIQRDRKETDGEITAYGDTEHGFIDLDNRVDLHYTDANNVEKVWTNKQAREKGFSFKYTLVENADLFEQYGDNGNKFKLTEKGSLASSAGKAGIVLVEVQANGKTYAYGYVTILITNTSVDANVKLDQLVLDCQNSVGTTETFKTSIAWSVLMDSLAKKLGNDFIAKVEDPDYYTFVDDIADLKKFADETGQKVEENSTKGILGKEGTGNDATLAWTFTEAEVRTAFYDNGEPISDAKYSTFFRIEPTDAGKDQGYQAITVKVTIPSVAFPAGSFSKDSRIQQMWFKQYSATIATSAAERDEIHANVEVLGQRNADDEFIFDISSTFVKNQFTITPADGFTFGEDADVFFDATKYARKGTNTYPETAVVTGASGKQYVLNLTSNYALTLYAAPIEGNAVNYGKNQAVVKLSQPTDPDVLAANGQHNQIATFQGFDDPVGGEYARDLLNHSRHDRLAKGQTFTTHMLLHQPDNCLPILETGDRHFDIRWLRPISANIASVKTVYDAQNDGNKIWLADLADFIDWRDHAFTTTTGSHGKGAAEYMWYYGITTIKADFEAAKTNINGGSLENPADWDYITDVTNLMKFEPDAKAKAAAGYKATSLATWNAADFKTENGYYLYENNAGGVGDFYIYLPVSIVYHWGETEQEWVLIHVIKTEGQHNQARQK